jgi:two-component system, OmpR family, response regulator
MPNSKLILVVDDEPNIRDMLGDFLESHGYRVLRACDGQEALALAGQHVPDLLLIDLLLPGEHGLEVIRQIKDSYFIPVLAMSGIYGSGQVARELDDFYLDGFFPKPLDLKEILNRVRAILHE